MKRKSYDAMPVCEAGGHQFRLVRSKNKTIALVEWSAQSPFAQASSLLEHLMKVDSIPRVISVDAMVVERSKAEAADRLGCIKASEYHEVIVYEDRGENLSFLKPPSNDPDNATDSWGRPIPNSAIQSGSERAELMAASERSVFRPSGNDGALSGLFSVAMQSLFRFMPKTPPPQTTETSRVVSPPQVTRTRAEMGQVDAPRYILASAPRDHARNAFIEYLALLRATKNVNLKNCDNILEFFRLGGPVSESLLKSRLEEAEAAIYNNVTSQVIRGTMKGQYMAAYSAVSGFVELNERETERIGRPKYAIPSNDPIVVTAKCTKIMLDDRILEMAKTIERSSDVEAGWGNWAVPKIQWVNGVPGCGKTTWVIRHFDVDRDAIITTTTEAAKDLREKLSHRIGDLVKSRVRTMASSLVNGFGKESFSRLLVDEALMNHFGAIIMAARLSGASELVLIGDVNQLPYIDRENLFEMRYHRPTLVANITQELLCTHRNPMDVAYALREIYSGIYSSAPRIRSLEQKRFKGAQISKTLPNTLFLVHTQEEKETLISQGYGGGSGSRTLTIHEAQGLTYESVIVIKTKPKMRLHESVSHAVVALSRHTGTFIYYADDIENDAISRFVRRASSASSETIKEYNLQMAVRDRNEAVMKALGQEKATKLA